MGLTSEIYLTKKFIAKEEWLELINTISNYNGFLRKWKIIITNDRNQIRYFPEFDSFLYYNYKTNLDDV